MRTGHNRLNVQMYSKFKVGESEMCPCDSDITTENTCYSTANYWINVHMYSKFKVDQSEMCPCNADITTENTCYSTANYWINVHMYSKFKVDQSEMCPCNVDIMTAEHLLQHCQMHDALRRDMWPEQRRHHNCRTSATALPVTCCSEAGHVARTKTTEGQAL